MSPSDTGGDVASEQREDVGGLDYGNRRHANPEARLAADIYDIKAAQCSSSCELYHRHNV